MVYLGGTTGWEYFNKYASLNKEYKLLVWRRIQIPSMSCLFGITTALTLFDLILVFSSIIGIPNVQSADGAYDFHITWGSRGNQSGQFFSPRGVAIDSSGNVFVADTSNHRIQKFQLSNPCPPGALQVVIGVCFITKWGTFGSLDGQFYFPKGVAIDSSGNVFVADSRNNRIQKFTNDGNFIKAWGTFGSLDGQFHWPADVAIDSSGNVFVADTLNDRIQKFTNDGNFIKAWGTLGSLYGQFHSPYGVAVDSLGYVFVADTMNNRIQKFLSDSIPCPPGALQVVIGVCFITKWGTLDNGNGLIDVAVDSSGNVFASSISLDSIQEFTNNGAFLTSWGESGSANGQFRYAWGVAVDSSGNVFVPDMDNHRIQVFVWRPDVKSSINLMNIINQAIGSKVNVTLSEAAATAAQGIGNYSRAVAAHLGEENGYLVYNIMVIDSRMNFSEVIVDPGNGKVLFSKHLSK